MEREEILRRAQAEKEDEREVRIRDHSLRWSYLVMGLLAAVFAFIRAQQGLPMMDLCATVSGSVCAGMAYRFWETRNCSYFGLAILTLLVAIVATVRFFLGH